MEKILVHREIEKQRRQEMSSLYASLRSLLPLEFIQGKRSTSDQVNEAVNYIKYMEKKNKHMNLKRDELILKYGVSVENLNHVVVVVRPCLVGVEIVFSVLRTRLSSVLEVIKEHGLCVVSCISSNVNNRVIYTIQAEVNDLAFVDLGYLKDTLTLMVLNGLL